MMKWNEPHFILGVDHCRGILELHVDVLNVVLANQIDKFLLSMHNAPLLQSVLHQLKPADSKQLVSDSSNTSCTSITQHVGIAATHYKAVRQCRKHLHWANLQVISAFCKQFERFLFYDRIASTDNNLSQNACFTHNLHSYGTLLLYKPVPPDNSPSI